MDPSTLKKRVGPKAPGHQREKEGRGRGYKRHEAPSTGREERGGKGTRPPKKCKGLTRIRDPRFIPTLSGARQRLGSVLHESVAHGPIDH